MQTAEGYYYTDMTGGMNRDPIVLIHGIGGNHLVWPAAMRRADGRRVLAVDLPGHGRSEGCAFRSVESYSSSLNAVLKSAGVFRAIFVGYSLGGQIAMEYSLEHPDQCAGLGLIAASAEPAVPSILTDLLNDPLAGAEVNRMIRTLVFWPELLPSQMFDLEKLLFTARKGTLVCDWQAFKTYSQPHLQEGLPQVPLWVCAASGDRLVSQFKARHLMARRKHARWDLLNDCAHALLVERPRELSNAFLSWLAGI
jgi:pimeloyl-ACP methyl ester carboxylesterase